MTKRIASIVAVTVLGIGSAALAGGDKDKHKGHPGMEGQQTGMMTEGAGTKHLALVDIYLDMAEDNVNLLHFLAAAQLEPKDRPLVNEVHKNLTLAIDGAIKHVGKVKTTDESGKQLLTSLKQAKLAAKKVRTAKLEQLSTSISEVATAIESAEGNFDTIAQNMGYTEIEDGAKQPVRGLEDDSDIPAPGTPPSPGTESPDKLPEPAQPTAPPSESPGY